MTIALFALLLLGVLLIAIGLAGDGQSDEQSEIMEERMSLDAQALRALRTNNDSGYRHVQNLRGVLAAQTRYTRPDKNDDTSAWLPGGRESYQRFAGHAPGASAEIEAIRKE
jgi:hypothetical protein